MRHFKVFSTWFEFLESDMTGIFLSGLLTQKFAEETGREQQRCTMPLVPAIEWEIAGNMWVNRLTNNLISQTDMACQHG